MIMHVADTLERRPRRINDESGEAEKNHERLQPPDIGAGRFAEATLLRQGISVRHKFKLTLAKLPQQRQLNELNI
jgi:hypothetical protein